MKNWTDAKLLFTNKDSLTYEIESENVYEEFFKWKDLFDFSNYSKDSKFFDETNKKVIGKMKDESEGKIIDEFVGLKSKMYSMLSDDGKESNTGKGLSIATEFNEFKDTLFNKKVLRYKMTRIQSKNHKGGTYEINKISLSCFDEKRWYSYTCLYSWRFKKSQIRKIFIKRRDFHRWSQIKIMCTNKFSIGGLIGVHVSSMV